MRLNESLLPEFDHEMANTRKTLERIPEDKFDWKPHEKSMTLGQLAMHVATLPGAIAELSTRSSFDVNTRVPRPSATSAAELIATFDQSVARARELLGAMDDAALTNAWRMMNGDREIMAMSRGALLRSVMLNHWYHHRGQLTVYLRQTGVPVPAIYGPSADERPFAG